MRNRRTPSALPVALLLAVTTAAASAAAVTNLLANPEFDAGNASWTVVSPEFHHLDPTLGGADGCIFGVADYNSAAGTSGTGETRQCIPVQAGQAYSFGILAKFVSEQARTGYTHAVVSWSANADCTSPMFATTTPTATTAVLDTWQILRSPPIVAPAGAIRGWFRIVFVKNEAGGTLIANLDKAYFVQAAGFLYADGFENHSECRWPLVN
jgi:hypothetical protein